VSERKFPDKHQISLYSFCDAENEKFVRIFQIKTPTKPTEDKGELIFAMGLRGLGMKGGWEEKVLTKRDLLARGNPYQSRA